MEVSVPVAPTTIDYVPNTLMIDKVDQDQLFVPVSIKFSCNK